MLVRKHSASLARAIPTAFFAWLRVLRARFVARNFPRNARGEIALDAVPLRIIDGFEDALMRFVERGCEVPHGLARIG